MKEGIHPNYNQTTITCACGNVLEVGSTKKDIKVDICSKCHPFWTGNLRQETAGGKKIWTCIKIKVEKILLFIFF